MKKECTKASVQAGPLKFAEWREAIDENDPATLLMEAEAEQWEQRLSDARAALRLFAGGAVPGMPRASWEIARNVVQRIHDVALTEVRDAGGDVEIPRGRMSLAEALGAGETAERKKLRLEHYRVFMRFIGQGGPRDLGALLKNFLTIARKVMPTIVDGMTQVEMGALVGDSKQAQRNREEKVELFFRSRGFAGFHLMGNTATEETRQKLAKSQAGNKNRATGTARKKAEAAKAAGTAAPEPNEARRAKKKAAKRKGGSK
jgi:hypothetical protein